MFSYPMVHTFMNRLARNSGDWALGRRANNGSNGTDLRRAPNIPQMGTFMLLLLLQITPEAASWHVGAPRLNPNAPVVEPPTRRAPERIANMAASGAQPRGKAYE